MKVHFIIIAIFMVLLPGCQKSKGDKFPESKNLSEYKNTDFQPTLESPINKGKNSIYCSTLLLAWDIVRTKLDGDLSVDSIDNDLFLLNNSNTFSNSLTKDEYSSSVNVRNDKIEVKVFFRKSLPFVNDLEDLRYALTFNHRKVSSFGVYGANSQVQILYYKNDSDFIVKLQTKDKSNELILYNVDEKFQNLIQAIQSVDLKIRQGINEKIDDRFSGNYSLNNDDKLIIPKLEFNIETDYPSMKNKIVHNKINDFEVMLLYQRTAFKLNESGAEIESEVYTSLSSLSMEDKPILKPKNLIFDKPFLLILRKTTSVNPYFAMWISNDELMIKK